MALRSYVPSNVVDYIVKEYLEDYGFLEQVILDQFVSYTGCVSDEIIQRDAMFVYHSLLPYVDAAQLEYDIAHNVRDRPDYYDDDKEIRKRIEMYKVIEDVAIKITHYQPWVERYLSDDERVIDFLQEDFIINQLLEAFVLDYRNNKSLESGI